MKTLTEYVKEKFNTRSSSDRRKKVDWYVVAYLDDQGHEYRKAYEFPVGTKHADVMAQIPKTIE